MNKKEVLKYSIIVLILVAVVYPTVHFVFKNKMLEKDLERATIHFLKEQCDADISEVQVDMEWYTIARRFGTRYWKAYTSFRELQGYITKKGTVFLGWNNCENKYLGEPSQGFILDREVKQFKSGFGDYE